MAAIIVSWAIAFFECTLAVPANRTGSAVCSVAELKTIQEAIALIVFAVFSVTHLGEALKPTTIGLPLRLHRGVLRLHGPLMVTRPNRRPITQRCVIPCRRRHRVRLTGGRKAQ